MSGIGLKLSLTSNKPKHYPLDYQDFRDATQVFQETPLQEGSYTYVYTGYYDGPCLRPKYARNGT